MRLSSQEVSGDVSCLRCAMMREVGVRQLMRDDGWEEIRVCRDIKM